MLVDSNLTFGVQMLEAIHLLFSVGFADIFLWF